MATPNHAGGVTPEESRAEKDAGEKATRLILPKRIAQMKRTMDGAERRMLRLGTELAECRAIIRRKYTDVLDEEGNAIGRNQLSSEHVYGYRLKRVQVEKDLALVKGEFLKARRAYRSAISNNFQIERKSVQMIREENKIQRESKKLLNATMAILKEHGSNGGQKEFRRLQELASKGDARAFRCEFDAVMEKFDPAHHTTISGVSQVKTEIIHAVMEQIAERDQKTIDSLSPAVRGTTSDEG